MTSCSKFCSVASNMEVSGVGAAAVMGDSGIEVGKGARIAEMAASASQYKRQ
jgi:hypothetical protein